jgi:hypothetical protein
MAQLGDPLDANVPAYANDAPTRALRSASAITATRFPGTVSALPGRATTTARRAA